MNVLDIIWNGFEPHVRAFLRFFEVNLFEPVGLSVESTPVVFIFMFFCILRLENQRWVKTRVKRFLDQPGPIGAFVDLTGGISLFFALAFVVAVGFDQGLLAAGMMAGCGLFATFAWSAISRWVHSRENGLAWVASTAVIWPVMWSMFDEVSWFGNYYVA